MKGNPIRANKDKDIIIDSIGKEIFMFLILRISCSPPVWWITVPAARNIRDLNSAWINKWINANCIFPIIKIIIINLICLIVENAIIFFKSKDRQPAILLRSIVKIEILRKIKLNVEFLIIGSIFINKITPAVTKVDEWTNAETGVGAAMAFGSQAEKGSWALFVKAAKAIMNNTIILLLVEHKVDHLPELNIKALAMINAISPSRFKMNVNIEFVYT